MWGPIEVLTVFFMAVVCGLLLVKVHTWIYMPFPPKKRIMPMLNFLNPDLIFKTPRGYWQQCGSSVNASLMLTAAPVVIQMPALSLMPASSATSDTVWVCACACLRPSLSEGPPRGGSRVRRRCPQTGNRVDFLPLTSADQYHAYDVDMKMGEGRE